VATFDKKIFMLGCGGVAQCTLPLLLKEISIAPSKITVMDFADNRHRIQSLIDEGVSFVQGRVTPENYQEILSSHLSPGDILIDLAWNIDTCVLLDWCHRNDVLFINTSVEEWDPYLDVQKRHPTDLTLYKRQMAMRKLVEGWSKKGATAVVDHGANPGLVSHLTKQGLIDIATKIIQEKAGDPRNEQLERAISDKNFAQLAMLTGVQTIHISERDTQITDKPKQVNEFVNSWSVEGLIEEGLAPAELGWGTHEKDLPKGAMTHASGPKNQICLSSKGIDTWVQSWVPSGPIIGMVIRHGEAFSISDYLTVWDGENAVYRPTVHYAYCPTDSTLNSLHEMKMRQFVPQERHRILNNEIISGADELGCLLMGHDFGAWWIGSVLDIDAARALVPEQNSTTLQVAISIVAAICCMIEEPELGLCLPDHLDHEKVLKIAKPYLGQFISQPTDWTPLSGENLHVRYGKNVPTDDELWQFSTLRVRTDTY
jgi:homospermidine synthase